MFGLTVAAKPDPFRIGNYFASLCQWDANNPNVMLALAGSTFLIVVIGAVLGGSIFPRVRKKKRRRTDH